MKELIVVEKIAEWQRLKALVLGSVSSPMGLRDRAILVVLLGCGLRRSEVAALASTHVQQRDGRWCIVDLVGSTVTCAPSRCRRG